MGVFCTMFGSLDCDIETVIMEVMTEVYRYESPPCIRAVYMLVGLAEAVQEAVLYAKWQVAGDRFFQGGSDLFGQNNVDYREAGVLVPGRSTPSDKALILSSVAWQEVV